MDDSTETTVVSDDLYQPCIACQGDDCPLCETMRVMPVGVNERQLSRLHKKAKLADVVLHAILHGHARWEYFGGRTAGELIFGGLRHYLKCDEQGLPILTDHAEFQLRQHVS